MSKLCTVAIWKGPVTPTHKPGSYVDAVEGYFDFGPAVLVHGLWRIVTVEGSHRDIVGFSEAIFDLSKLRNHMTYAEFAAAQVS